ncbi:MAG: hypothetical protein V3T62_03500 [Alphaproteobacteria bacterium]
MTRQSAVPRAECFSLHDMVDRRDTKPLLCAWAGRVRPLLPDLARPRGFMFRP